MHKYRLLVIAGVLYGLGVQLSCTEDQVVIAAQVQRADGRQMFAGDQAATLRLELDQGDNAPDVYQVVWPTNDLNWTVPVSRTRLLRVSAEYLGPDIRLLGASPLFTASDASSGLRVTLAAPATCETLVDLQLAVPRTMAGFAAAGTTGVVVGGEPDDEDASVEFINLVNLQRYSYVDRLDRALGSASIVVLDSRLILIISEKQPTLLYDISVPAIVPADEDLGSVTVPAQPQVIEFETGVRVELIGNSGTTSDAVQICIPEEINMETP